MQNKSKRLLMVCAGNICRSPLAHGLMDKKIKENKLPWEVDSAGTHGFHSGELPDSRSVEIAHQHGLDITYQRARKIRSTDIADFDLIFCMDAQNYNAVLDLCETESERAKVKLILNELYPGENRIVPDPYYGGGDGFQKVYIMLNNACDAIVKNYG